MPNADRAGSGGVPLAHVVAFAVDEKACSGEYKKRERLRRTPVFNVRRYACSFVLLVRTQQQSCAMPIRISRLTTPVRTGHTTLSRAQPTVEYIHYAEQIQPIFVFSLFHFFGRLFGTQCAIFYVILLAPHTALTHKQLSHRSPTRTRANTRTARWQIK